MAVSVTWNLGGACGGSREDRPSRGGDPSGKAATSMVMRSLGLVPLASSSPSFPYGGLHQVDTRKFLLAPATALGLAMAAFLPGWAAPESTGSGGITDPALTTVISSVGDDIFSTTDLSNLLDPVSVAPTQHYGPYSSSSPDSSTCGGNWATDTFNRHFTVRTSRTSGEISVFEQFKDGSFVTMAGPSPAACDATYTNHGTIVSGGVDGSMHGYFIVPLPPGTVQTSNSQYCDAVAMTNTSCDTATFIDTHFTPCYGAFACSATTFFFDYAAGAQGLLYHDWKNASTDRGGNTGDVANS